MMGRTEERRWCRLGTDDQHDVALQSGSGHRRGVLFRLGEIITDQESFDMVSCTGLGGDFHET